MSTTGNPIDGPRIQLALNVDDVGEAVAFYSRLFAAEPAKRRPGYANFALTDPPLKLVLLENPGLGGSLNHLGVEVETTEDVAAAVSRFHEQGMQTRVEDATTCCYAVQDKVWVTGPGGERWEVYTVVEDAPLESSAAPATAPAPAATRASCCA